jgi:hypothetical protein
MAFEVMQEFTFNADAKEVYDFFMQHYDAQESGLSPNVEYSDGNFSCRCYFMIGGNSKALYSIILTFYLQASAKFHFDFLDEKLYWLVSNDELGEIALTQETQGTCKAELWCETSASRWSDKSNLPYRVGTRFIGELWRRLIEDWLRWEKTRKQTQTTPTEPATMRAQEQDAATEQAKPMILQFALRHKYLIAGIILAVVITVASLLLFPDWARSNLTLVILFPVAFAAATGFIADIRKAYG